nr:immunoglobulin heavy chain junction region [Mus musculus]NSM05683.1 immunoglobulin heavy chain junction region [Mus musculus]NSM09005.1 immunoglobulin heavy chain junction region [Mus musculus]
CARRDGYHPFDYW